MQTETNNFTPRRRATDDIREPTLHDIWQKLNEIEQRQIANTTAFLVNDLGHPDYDGHRRSHKEMVRAAESLQGYKTDATKKVIGGVLGVVGTLLALGVLSWLQQTGLK